jgi:flagellar hook-associated protein 3 FlgL
VLRDIAGHLRSGIPADVESLRTTDLRNLDNRLGDVLEARTTTGALTNRLDAAAQRLDDVVGSADRLRSETEDADMAKSILELSTQQSVYQAALRSGASIIQPSLLDFLR